MLLFQNYMTTLLEIYKQLSKELDIEPKEKTVLGSFLTSVQEPERQDAKS